MYAALGLEGVSYTEFVSRATQLVVRGLSDGWVEVDLPAAPTPDDSAYRVRFVDPDRWADELTAAFEPNLSYDEEVRTDR